MSKMNKCSCGNPKEAWQDVCKSCYAKKMGWGIQKPSKTSKNSDDILRQVCLKVSGMQLQKATPSEVIGYAKQLYTLFQGW